MEELRQAARAVAAQSRKPKQASPEIIDLCESDDDQPQQTSTLRPNVTVTSRSLQNNNVASQRRPETLQQQQQQRLQQQQQQQHQQRSQATYHRYHQQQLAPEKQVTRIKARMPTAATAALNPGLLQHQQQSRVLSHQQAQPGPRSAAAAPMQPSNQRTGINPSNNVQRDWQQQQQPTDNYQRCAMSSTSHAAINGRIPHTSYNGQRSSPNLATTAHANDSRSNVQMPMYTSNPLMVECQHTQYTTTNSSMYPGIPGPYMAPAGMPTLPTYSGGGTATQLAPQPAATSKQGMGSATGIPSSSYGQPGQSNQAAAGVARRANVMVPQPVVPQQGSTLPDLSADWLDDVPDIWPFTFESDGLF